jgi:hypothetical protein
MKFENHLSHSDRAHTKRELNTPVLLWVGGLGAFWTTVALLIFM